MDDSYIICENKEKLKEFSEILFKMYSDIGIVINKKKTRISPLTQHFTFLKTRYKIAENNKIIKKPCRSSITRTRRRIRKMIQLYKKGEMTAEEVNHSFQSMRGSMLHRNARKSMYKIEKELKHALCLQCRNGRIFNDNAF